MGEKAGLHYVTLGRIENAKENVTIFTLFRIASTLGVRLTALLHEEEDVATPDLNAGTSDRFVLKQLGDRISQLREKKRWSQRDLAKRTGLHHVTICRIEKGLRNAALLDLLTLARALEVDEDILSKM